MQKAFLPRGIRNNNPGNIRKSFSAWRGKISGKDKEFETFDTPEYGLRALMKLLMNYQKKYGLNTIHGLINRWAPENENDTASYVMSVSKDTNLPPHKEFDFTQDTILIPVAQAIVLHENGHSPEGWPYYWYDVNVYRSAFELI